MGGPRLLRSSVVAAGLTLLVGILLSVRVGLLDAERRQSDARSRVVGELATVRARLEGAVKATFSATEGLVDVIGHQGGISPALFHSMAELAIHNHPHIRIIAVAPDDTVRLVHPLAGNESVVGFRYATVPEQHRTVLQARAAGHAVLSGPVTLVQGGEGLILRAPVFVRRQVAAGSEPVYWGLASIVAKVDAILDAGGVRSSPGLAIGLRGKDGRGAAGERIWGEERAFSDQPVTMDVEIPGGRWQILAVPKRGWPSASAGGSPYFYLGIAESVLLAGFVGVLFGRQRQIQSRNRDLVREIAERRRVERELRLSEQKYASIFDLSPDIVGIAERADGRLVEVNPGFEEGTGWARGEALGRSSVELGLWDEPTRAVAIGLLGEKGRIENFEFTFTTRSGAKRTALLYLTSIQVQGVDCFYFMVRDVTELKQAEEASREMERRLYHGQRLESLGVLAGGIAHDFNNLLGGLFGYLDLARLAARDPAALAYLDKALSSFNRAKDLTRRLLTFAGGGAPVRRPGPVGPLIEESAAFALSGSALRCEVRIADDLWWSEFDENQLGQVIDNLVINAQQAMPSGGTIVVAAGNVAVDEGAHPLLPAGKYVNISVTDTGSGIPPSILPHIFDPFFTTKQHGSGLGLATCYSIVRRHEGVIEVDSEPSRGSTFHVYLPALEPGARADAAPAPAAPSGTGRVLVMDDEEAIRDVVTDMLSGLGYAVVSAKDGAEALARVAEDEAQGRPIAAMILDLTVPGRPGGRDIIGELRASHPVLPIFATSGYSVDPVMAQPTAFGFTDRLQKPFRVRDVADLLARYLGTA